jgi:uncharacterized protein YycO
LAAPKGGSQKKVSKILSRTNLKEMRNLSLQTKSEFQYSIPEAINKANSLLGKPYNFNYILNDEHCIAQILSKEFLEIIISLN